MNIFYIPVNIAILVFQMNLTKARDTIFESAKRLNNYTIENKHLLTDTMDIVFVTRTVRKYLEFLDEEKNVIMF